MSRLFPHPLMTLFLWVVWMMLTRFSPGMAVLGGLIAISAGLSMSRLQMPRVRIRNWGKLARLVGIVTVDIMRSNIAVARLVVQGPQVASARSGFLEMQLRLRDRNALALLAIILTATPGTAWLEYDPPSGMLLLHVFDLVDEEDWRDLIRNRYESLLMEIFE